MCFIQLPTSAWWVKINVHVQPLLHQLLTPPRQKQNPMNTQRTDDTDKPIKTRSTTYHYLLSHQRYRIKQPQPTENATAHITTSAKYQDHSTHV